MGTVRRSRETLDRFDWLVVVLPALLAGALCAWKLGSRSLWLDEGASLSIASQHGARLWSAIAHDGGNMLVYYLALHVMIGVLGDGEVALRVLSALADAVTAGLVGLLGLRLFASRTVAAVAGVLCAVSVGLVFWGQDARGYAAMVAAATGSFYALVVLLTGEPSRGRRGQPGRRGWLGRPGRRGRPGRHGGHSLPRGALVGYVLSTTLALYIGFDAALLLPAQLLLAVMLGFRPGLVIGALALVAALCVPLIVLALDRGSGQLFWVPALSLSVLSQTLVTLESAGLPPNFHTSIVTVIAVALSSALALAALALAWRAHRTDDGGGLVLVPVVWLVLPLGLGVLASAVGEPTELARISILMIPALALLLAWMLGRVDRVVRVVGVGRVGRFGSPGVSSALGLVLLAAILALRLATLIPSYSATPEPWREVTAHVLGAARTEDCIAFYPEDGRMPFSYYVQRTPGASARAPRPLLPAEPWSSRQPHVEQYRALADPAVLTRGCQRVWLVASHQGQRHGTAISREHLAGYVTLQHELALLYPHRTETHDGYAATITVSLFTR